MKYLILLVFFSLLLANNGFADLNSNNQIEEARLISNSKIHPILLKWQTSENPVEFAKINGLEYRDEKIQVYIYLIDENFLPKLSSDIDVIASDQKIAVAYVSPSQLDEFENLDYVERVTIPDLAINPPLPQTATTNEVPKKEQNNFTLFSFLVIVIIICTIMMIFLKIKKSKNRYDS